MSRSVTSSAIVPSGVAQTSSRAAASSSTSRSTGQRTRCSTMRSRSSARRSPACRSAVSSTAWTSEPKVAPTGSPAIGERMPVPARSATTTSSSSWLPTASPSGSVAPESADGANGISPRQRLRARCRRCAASSWSMLRVKSRAAERVGVPLRQAAPGRRAPRPGTWARLNAPAVRPRGEHRLRRPRPAAPCPAASSAATGRSRWRRGEEGGERVQRSVRGRRGAGAGRCSGCCTSAPTRGRAGTGRGSSRRRRGAGPRPRPPVVPPPWRRGPRRRR